MMKMKKKNKRTVVVFTFVLTMLLLVGCGKDTKETTDVKGQEVVEQTTNKEENNTETIKQEEKQNDNIEQEEQENKEEQKDEVKTEEKEETKEKEEVPIYSINDESLETEQTYVEIEEVTPESVVHAVITSLKEHSLEIGIDSVTMEGDTVIVSFLFGTAPLSTVGSTVEETILNSIADSLLDNIEDCKKVIFRAEGEAYESGHYAFEIDEVYASK